MNASGNTLIHQRVLEARVEKNQKVICKMNSGWAVIGDVQFLEGYCLLLPDPVVASLNDLSLSNRIIYLEEMAWLGDAIMNVTGCDRINYEILGNLEPALHAHVFPRFQSEPESKRTKPVWFYDWENAPKFEVEKHKFLMENIRNFLQAKLTNQIL